MDGSIDLRTIRNHNLKPKTKSKKMIRHWLAIRYSSKPDAE